ncbi:MAG: PAS domain-containing protein [Candidatus Brocadia sp.]|nr:PAS domain-containing protein [Candidatus Brocadia sp.]
MGKKGKDSDRKKEPLNAQSPNKSASPSRKKKALPEKIEKKTFPIVGIGASAGGLEAFEQFFSCMPSESGIAFVLVPHLDPNHTSMMPDLLRRYTTMKVVEIKDKMRVEPDRIYIIPPNKDMSMHDGFLHLSAPQEPHGLRMPIDFFFRSLAEDCGERAICIILSGNGTDGTMGLRAIHGVGGMSMVQDVNTAKYDGMPKSAIGTGLSDYVLTVEKMPAQLDSYIKHTFLKKAVKIPSVTDKTPDLVQKILAIIKNKTGHDFSMYKKSTINRRIERRMNLHDIEEPSTYARYLQEHPDEVKMLFKELLIVVTSFFRDPEAFEVLKKKILPKYLEGKPESYTVRIWVPGCATGEEVYSHAMILKECMEEMKREFKMQIFGTDIDEDAINTARAGVYPSNISIDVDAERLKRFFVKEENGYRIKKDIRETAIFSMQNVVKDPPFTRMDIISCRNLLIYLENELQNKLLPVFQYSLKPEGILFLGTSESIGGFINLFTVIDKKWKIFRCKESMTTARVLMIPEPRKMLEPISREVDEKIRKAVGVNIDELAARALLEKFAPPCAIINEQGNIFYIHGRTGKYLEPARGKPNLNILEMVREGLQLELRSAIHTAISRKKDVVCEGLQVKTNGSYQIINLMVKRIVDLKDKLGLLMVAFEDVAPAKKGAKPKVMAAQKYDRRTSKLEQELKYTKDSLRATVEELQASNEELKSANEELQSSNEELQSTNEELETSKEELQSVNEELITVNSELQSKIEQLSRTENDMRNLLDSIKMGIIFLDNNLHIKRFTMAATRVFNLIASDVGRPISHIVSNLKYEGLIADAQEVLDKLAFKELEVRTKDKKWFLVRIVPYRTMENVIEGAVITFTDINEVKQSEEELRKLNITVQAARKLTESITETIREPLVVMDADQRVVSANKSFYSTFKVTRKETEGRLIYELGNHQWDIPELRRLLREILPKNNYFEDFKVCHEFPVIGRRLMLLNARRIANEGAGSPMILLAFEDITNHKETRNSS